MQPILTAIPIILVLAAIAIVIRLPQIRRLFLQRPAAKADAIPYKSRNYLLTKGEAAFYHSLRRAVGDRYMIATKVRLVDVLTCERGAWKGSAGNRLTQKHLDFVLCDPDTTKIVAAIELDDRSHGRADRQQRDNFLDAAMSAAGVPLIHFPAAMQYDATQLAGRIAEVCGSPVSTGTAGSPAPVRRVARR